MTCLLSRRFVKTWNFKRDKAMYSFLRSEEQPSSTAWNAVFTGIMIMYIIK